MKTLKISCHLDICNQTGVNQQKRIIWKSEQISDYIHNLGSATVQQRFVTMAEVIHEIPNVADPTDTVNAAVAAFTEGIRSAADPLFLKTFIRNDGVNRPTRKRPQWATEEWGDLKKMFLRSRDKYKRNPSDINKTIMIEMRKNYKRLSKQLQNSYDNLQTRKLINSKINNIKLYWKMLAGKRRDNTGCKVDIKDLYNHFLRLSDPEDDFFCADPYITEEVCRIAQEDIILAFEELNVPIVLNEVLVAIKLLKSGKCGAEDFLINEYFVHGQKILGPHLVTLFNAIFDSGIFPEIWSDGLLLPLHKKGSQFDPQNFRGITLLSTLGKLFTRILNRRLDNWAENYGIYVEAQNGFRKGRGTVDSAFILQNMVNDFLETGKKLYAFFIDYSKAFDYVVHDNLWFKLLKCGVRGKIVNLIRNMYCKVKTNVFSNGIKSPPFYSSLDVRQGECLSPFLFAIYVNDLEDYLRGANAGVTISDVKFLLLLYADDVVIFAESAEKLQEQINKLYMYCMEWRLRLNTEKSQILVFRRGSTTVRDDWYYGASRIKVTNKISYLGLVFSSNGFFKNSQATLADQASKALFQLHKTLHKFKNVPVSLTLDLFDKFISPILNYASEVWGFHSAPEIERIHLTFCKNILGVKKTTQNDFVYGLLGRHPLQIDRYCKIMNYWLKIVSGAKPFYVNTVYHASKLRANLDSSYNWASKVKKLLHENGYGDVWENQGVYNPDAFMYVFRQRLIDIYKQNWNTRLTESPRARFYRVVINDLSFYEQLDKIHNKSHRNALARLITSSHRLRVETGRWERPVIPYESRICTMCHKLDDEFHFLLECPRYHDIRRQYLPTYFRVRPSMFKCIELLNTNNDKTVRSLAKYVFEAFRVRSLSVSWYVHV